MTANDEYNLNALPSDFFENLQKVKQLVVPKALIPLKRPTTPQTSNDKILAKAMRRLSVSPSNLRKPQPKKRKIASTSVIAPIFNISRASALGPKALEYHAKVDSLPSRFFIIDLFYFQKANTLAADSENDILIKNEVNNKEKIVRNIFFYLKLFY